ncbi:type VI secretion system baseplate subunit TssE [Paraburkholderia tagetis]|uniref:Type VI secretion system baseplate subunit TssE n=1 Tax=Paraburkholderia tagetis TaxID=2913261 RepID=A0A9X1UJI9_9BURK|nr:type VI secretion system baseplate subunit TssE [Paraburkholderia tagetis]MCG5076762.1 type VI secretion system baseplate subunit TssE [Paraburkholderia tagetis]
MARDSARPDPVRETYPPHEAHPPYEAHQTHQTHDGAAPRRMARPMLFDRLRDDVQQRPAAADSPYRGGSHAGGLLEAVLRDLSWLLNTACALDERDARRYAEAGRSVLNFGVPAFAGTPLSGIDTPYLENALREAIVCFEPRLQGESVEVRCVNDARRASRHNVLTFEIAGRLACVEPPLSMLLQTELDLDSGIALLRPLNGSGEPEPAGARMRRKT